METEDHQTLTVLVAHRDESRRTTIRDGLEEAGVHVVAEASTGEDALELALETRPTVCLLDLQIRGQSGLAVAQARLKALKNGLRPEDVAPLAVFLASLSERFEMVELRSRFSSEHVASAVGCARASIHPRRA